MNRLFDVVAQDVRYALRIMRKQPGFALTIVLTLSFAVGANAAIFTLVRAVLLRPLHYHDPDRLVQITGGATPIRYDEIRASARSYSAIGAYLGQVEEVAISGGAGPESLKQARVSANFLTALGVDPLLGRGFLVEEDRPEGTQTVLISANLWQRRFGGDPQIVGRTIVLAGTSHVVVGVMSADFQFPFSGIDVWVPRPAENVTQFSPLLVLFARLVPGVSLPQATAELSVLNHQYAVAHPGMLDTKQGKPAEVLPLKQELVAGVQTMLWMLFGAVTFVLLIACANVAGLLLARAASRQGEFAVRAAVGAGRGRIVSQLLVESLLLALASAVLGLIVARLALAGTFTATSLDLPRMADIHLDAAVLAFAVAISVVTGVLFGLAPSLSIWRLDLISALKFGRSSSERKRIGTWFNTRGLLISGQVALSVVLLIGAALLIETLAGLSRVDLGFDSENLLTLRISLPHTRYDTVQKTGTFQEELVTRVKTLPGVRGAATVFTAPITGFAMQPVQPADAALLPLNKRPLGVVQFITTDYFRMLGIPMREGREFTAHDRNGTPDVAIISESLARRLWPEYPKMNPIGQHVLIGVNKTPIEVVGIVGDIRQSLEGDLAAGFYRPALQAGPPTFAFVVRTTGDPLTYVNAIRREVLSVDRDQPISSVKTMTNLIEEEVGQRRLVLLLLGVFASAALLLTAIGIYGMLTYWVVQRTRELGIRRALGATTGNLLWLVVGKGLALTTAGVIIGIAAASALTRVLEKLLFHVSPIDPAAFITVATLVPASTLVACYLPARTATHIQPIEALRFE